MANYSAITIQPTTGIIARITKAMLIYEYCKSNGIKDQSRPKGLDVGKASQRTVVDVV